jgi:hypothetical protein
VIFGRHALVYVSTKLGGCLVTFHEFSEDFLKTWADLITGVGVRVWRRRVFGDRA